MNCTVCPGNNIRVKFIKNGYPIIHCLDCDHLYTDYTPTQEEIKQIYSDDYFSNGGAGYENYFIEEQMLIKRGEYYAEKMGKYMKPGKLLDVGSAAGFLLKGFENKNWKGVGIDPNRVMVEYGKKNLGLNLLQSTLETIELEEKFDLIILIQVIAHLNNIDRSIDRLSEFLIPGGHILIETWDKNSLTARFFGKYWHEYSPPSTLNYFSKKSLNHFMNQQSFTLVDEGFPKKSIHSSHAKSLLTHKLKESNMPNWVIGATKLIPGNIIIPYPLKDLFWALYKKN